MIEKPERKSPTEQLDIQRKTEDIISGKRPVDILYPYIPPDYKVPFLHIGTEKQLFLDNFILDRFDGVTRVFPKPDRPDEPIIKHWNSRGNCAEAFFRCRLCKTRTTTSSNCGT